MKKLLKLLLKLYHFIIKLRILFYQSGFFNTYKCNSKVISIGNISFGGSGKTPLTIEIANNLKNQGYKVSILSRGYKRKDESTPKIIFNGENFNCTIEESGDEPYLIAKKTGLPVCVSKERVKGADILIKHFSPDFIILDDGFQHLKLFRDHDILLLSEDDITGKNIFLREPFENIKRADSIIITKVKNISNLKKLYFKIRKFTKKDIFYANFKIKFLKDLKNNDILNIDYFKNREIIIFCGIANPDFLKFQLLQYDLKVEKIISFKDHVKYSEKEYKILDKYKNKILITTEKDEVKLNKDRLKDFNIFVIVVDLEIKNIF